VAVTLRSPETLLLLLLVPGLVVLALYVVKRRDGATRSMGDPRLVASLVAGRSPALRTARAALFVSGIALLVFALAGPRMGSREETVIKRGLDLVVALDFSKSMWAEDVAPNRIDRAKAELSAFMGSLAGDRVGVVAFAGETVEFPMTTDYAAIELFLRDLGPEDMPVGGTGIARALLASQRLLERGSKGEKAAKVILLVTDGEDHEGDPRVVAEELAAKGTRVFTVGVGSAKGEPIPLGQRGRPGRGYLRDRRGEIVLTALTPQAEGALRDIARETGGVYVRAAEGTVGFRAIQRELERLERTEAESKRVTVHEERFTLALLPAFFFLLLSRLVPEGTPRRRREAKP
jgi:Ca-activated chloride channel homolog